MNIHAKVRPGRPHRTTQPTRRLFTASEVLAMEAAGILGPDENVELLDGEIVTMAPKSPRHEDMRTELCEFFAEHRS